MVFKFWSETKVSEIKEEIHVSAVLPDRSHRRRFCHWSPAFKKAEKVPVWKGLQTRSDIRQSMLRARYLPSLLLSRSTVENFFVKADWLNPLCLGFGPTPTKESGARRNSPLSPLFFCSIGTHISVSSSVEGKISVVLNTNSWLALCICWCVPLTWHFQSAAAADKKVGVKFSP